MNCRGLVSVILPVRNGARTLARALSSVLGQTHSHLEVVLIDDGSRDKTGSIASAFARRDRRVRVLANRTSRGLTHSLNQGILNSTGEFIARIDHDDLWTDSKKLARQAAIMNSDRSCVLIGTGAVLVDPGGKIKCVFRPPVSDAGIRRRILRENVFFHSSVLFRRSALAKSGLYAAKIPFREKYRYCEDYDLWLRLGLAGGFRCIPDAMVKYSLGTSGLSYRNRGRQVWIRLGLILKYGSHYPGRLRALMSLAREFLAGLRNSLGTGGISL